MWTKEKPVDPGFYWYRHNANSEYFTLKVFGTPLSAQLGFGLPQKLSGLTGEFWSRRIEEPHD